MKNSQQIFLLSANPEGDNESSSRAVNLLLEQDDELYLKLIATYQIFDDPQMYNTFSGFLIFPM